MRIFAAAFFAALALSTVPFSALPVRAQELPFEPARRADDFVDTIGVATHWGYTDTPYGYAYETVKALLAASGIRHVRDGLHPHLEDLYIAHGIRATIGFPPGDASGAAQQARENRRFIAMIEGPNEVAVFPQSAAYKGKTFPEGPRLWTNDLYRAVRALPELGNIPLIAPSTGKSGVNAALAPLTAFDLCVMHSYAGGGIPSSSLYAAMNNNITDAYDILGNGATLKPLVVTESGYHTALGSSVVIGGAQPGVSEKAQGKYLPRHFAEYFNAGVVRTFTYEFIDEFDDYKKDEREATNAEACFGMIKRDLMPKPAYVTVKNLIALLSEAKWDVTAQQWRRPAPEFSPRALHLSLSGVIENVHHTLLQKADGDYYLLLWQEIPSFDLIKREDLAPPDAKVTVSLSTLSTLTIYRPNHSAAPVRLADNKANVLTLDVPDEVTVVRIHSDQTPVLQNAGKRPAPPALRVTGNSTRDTVTLSWKPQAAPVFLYRIGRHIATISDPKTTSYTDTGLLPGKGYPYQIVTCDNQGQMSAPQNIVVATKAEFADLIITEVGMAEKPVAGQPVLLTATIKNIGSAPTPAGVVHGVAFSVDGQFLCWSDTFTGPLKPGESKQVTSSGGPKGIPQWVAVSGSHKISALADDVHRIPEKSHENNSKEVTITVP